MLCFEDENEANHSKKIFMKRIDMTYVRDCISRRQKEAFFYNTTPDHSFVA